MGILYLFVGVMSGALLTVIGLTAQASLWATLVLYSFGGALGMMGLATVAYHLQRNRSV